MDGLFILVVLVVFTVAYYFRPRDPTLPPGPRPLPIVGNLISLLRAKSYLKLQKEHWAQWGDIMFAYLGPYPSVTIRGYKNIHEAFFRRGEEFSGKPTYLPIIDIYSGPKGIAHTEGERSQKLRRFTLTCLRDHGLGKKSIEDKILEENKFLTLEIGKHDGQVWERPISYLYKSAANIVCSLIFGDRFDYDDPRFVRLLDALRKGTREADSFPLELFFHGYSRIRKWLPIREKRSLFLEFLEYWHEFSGMQIEEHRTTFDPDNIRDYVDMYLKVTADGHDDIDGEDMLVAISDLLIAGTETTSTTLDWAIAYMIDNPDIQKRCQDEIDQVIGQGRAVQISDRSNLPYVDATLHEIQRHASIFAVSLPHTTYEEVMFMGYRIPARCMVFINMISAMRDPRHWEDPDKFKPERFLGDDGKIKKNEAFIPFSLGPRMCLGESLARMELFLTFSNLLQEFRFEGCEPIDWEADTLHLYIRSAPKYIARPCKRE